MKSFVYLLAVFVSLSVFAPVNVDARDLLKKVQKRGRYCWPTQKSYVLSIYPVS